MPDSSALPPVRSYRLPGLAVEEYRVPVPLDHFGRGEAGEAAAGEGWQLEVFARVVGTPGSEKPYLLYLQGGPGSEAFRPTASDPAWLPRALEDFRVVMLDQRGTGLSGAIGIVDDRVTGVPASLAEAPRTDPQIVALAEHLTHYRADAIVEDAEYVRKALGVDTWSVLGQSFGGFCTLRYVQEHPDALDAAFFTGGLPAVGPSLREVYSRTWRIMETKSRRFAAEHPESAEALRALAARVTESPLALPDGTLAGPAHVRALGHLLGASGGAEKLHYLLELPIDSAAFRHDLLAVQPFGARNPLYAAVHESCWANGEASEWTAEAVMPEAFRTDPTLLAGEHIARDFFTSGPLAAWEDVAHVVASVEWPVMWEAEKLRSSEVPAAAAIYFEDAFVPLEFSVPTADLLPGMRRWVTSEYEHNGLRASGPTVLDHLVRLVRGM